MFSSYPIVNRDQILERIPVEMNCNSVQYIVLNLIRVWKINKIHKPESRAQYEKYFSDFTEDSFLKLLLIKRKAFEYESEVRMFIVPHFHQPINPDRDFAKYVFRFSPKVMKSMIKQISIDPSCTELETEIIKAKIESLGYTCSQNPLYKEKDLIVIGEII